MFKKILILLTTISLAFCSIANAKHIRNTDYKIFNVEGEATQSENLVRIISPKGKMGFMDTKGNIIITPQYDYVYPFRNGVAKVTKKATFYIENGYRQVSSNSWYFINRRNQKVE